MIKNLIVFSTRPEAMKMAPLVNFFNKVKYVVCIKSSPLKIMNMID